MVPAWKLRVEDALNARVRRRGLEQLRGLLQPAPGLRLLDVGGGTGLVAEMLGGPWAEVVVLEPEARKVAHGRSRRPGLRFVEGAAEHLPFPDASFDRAMMLVAFHHMHDQPRALREVLRVLCPGGRLVVHELDPAQAGIRALRWLERRVHGHHGVQFVGPEHLRRALEDAGFRNVEAHPAPRGYLLTAEAPGSSAHAEGLARSGTGRAAGRSA